MRPDSNISLMTPSHSSISHVPPAVPWQQDASVMGLVGLAHASSHFAHLILPAMFPVFMQEFGLNFSQMGLLMTVFFVISGLGQAAAGFVVDRFGARPILLLAVAFLAAASVAGALATGYAGLMGVAVLAGLGNASFHPVDFSILNQRVSAPRLGHAFSTHGLTGNLGWAAAPVFMLSCTHWWGWRQAYVGAALMYLLVWLVLFICRDKLQTRVLALASGGATPAGPASGLALLRLPVIWWCFAFFMLSTMTLAVIQSFSVSILQALHAVSLQQATYTLTAYMLCGALGMLAGGFVAARVVNNDRVVALCMAAAAVALATCGLGIMGAWPTMVVLALTGFAIGIGGPSRDLMIKKATPKGATGRVYGLVYSGLDVGFSLSPLLFGRLMDRGWFNATLLGAAFVLLLSVIAALGVGWRVRQA